MKMIQSISFYVLISFINLVTCQGERAAGAAADAGGKIYLGNPFYSTTEDDTYCGTIMPIEQAELHITKFIPNATASIVHHMILEGCESINRNLLLSGAKDYGNGVYGACGSAIDAVSNSCGKKEIFYAWAKNAPPFKLPKGVSYSVGTKRSIKYFFLNVHYAHPVANDNSGLWIEHQAEPTPKTAGIRLMAVWNNDIPPDTKSYTMYASCRWNSKFPIHPFAARTHAHGNGVVITGWVFKDESTVKPINLVRGSPQMPQFFYPVLKNITIDFGDAIAATCTYNTSGKQNAVTLGAKNHNEMCNLYIMYSADAKYMSNSWNKPQMQCYNDELELQSFIPDEAKRPLTIAEKNSLYDHAEEAAGFAKGTIFDRSAFIPHHEHTHTNHVMKHTMKSDATTVLPTPDFSQMLGMENEEESLPGQQMNSNHIEVDTPEIGEEVTESGGYNAKFLSNIINGNKVKKTKVQSKELEQNFQNQLVGLEAPRKLPKYSLERSWFGYSSVPGGKLGQAVAVQYSKNAERVIVLHRADRVWGMRTFNLQNRFLQEDLGPIRSDVVLEIDRRSGKVVNSWGKNFFYMPHGLYIDKDENYWITDVAMQQVFKFSKSDRTKPQLTLGKKFEPGNGKQQFCKPSDVVVLRDSGDFFVSDGYCNKRIVRFSSKGEFKQQIPRQALIDSENSVLGEPGPLDLELPHALALDDDENMLFVADRLHSRIQVFSVKSEKFLSSINPGVFQPALYSMVYRKGLIVAVNGNDTGLTRGSSIHGIILNATDTSKYVIFGETVITNPHDVAISPDLQEIIVVELGPNKIWKFSTGIQVVEESKPTGLTQESSSGSMKSLIHNYSPVSAFTLLLFAFPVVLIYLCLMYLRRRRRLHTEPTTSLGLRGNRFDRSENTMGYRKLATNDALEEHFHLDTDSDDDEMFNRMTSSKT